MWYLSTLYLCSGIVLVAVVAADPTCRYDYGLLVKLPRCASCCRKIFNELSDNANMAVPKIEDDGDSNDSLMSDDDMPVNTSGMLTHATAGGGMQTLTMTNAASTAAQVANNSTGATIVQYAQGADGQFFIPGRFSYNPPKQVYLRVTYVLQSLEKCLKKYQLLYLVCECTLSLT